MVERCLGFRAWMAGLALVIGGLLAPAPAVADWSSSGCSGCHGTPPDIANSVANAPGACPAPNFTLGLGEAFMANQPAFQAHVNSRGTSCSVAEMSGLAGAETTSIYNYLVNVRDGSIGNFTPSFADTAVGSFRDDSVSFAVRNYRNPAMTYGVSASGDYSIVSHTATGTGCSAGNVPAATTLSGSACTVNLTIRFTPSAAGTRFGSVTVNPAINSGIDYLSRVVNFSADAFVPTPGFSRTPASLTLIARLGSTDNGIVTISNPVSATANLILSSLPFSGTAGVFSRTGTCVTGGGGIAPGGSCTVIVTYTPSAASAQNGLLTINHNAPGSPSTVTLNATGTQSLISPTSNTIAFGNVQQGVPRLLTQLVTNSGTATLNFQAPLPNSSGARTGAAAVDYTVSGCAAPLAPGGNCTLSITLTPSALGSRPATLTISSDATNGPAVFTLTGTGVALPEPLVTPPASDFPDTVIGQTATQTRTVTIQNDRTRTITYSVSNTTDFTVGAESCAGRVVAGSGGICTIQIQFQPTLGAGEGRRTATLPFSFTGLAPDPDPTTVAVNVAGNALLPLAQSATSLNAAAVVGSPTTTSMLLTNRSSAGITLSTLLFSGAAAADYSLAAANTCSPGLLLAASATCTLVVRFNPPVAGTRNATLTITHSALGSAQTVTYLGSATPAPQGLIQLSSSNLSYADTQLASSTPLTVTVHNGGDLALNFSAFTFGGANPGDFNRGGSCAVGTPLPIAADCTLIVNFAPTALGLRSATLTITSDASNGAAVITLSGTGVPIPAPQVSLTPALLDFGTQTIAGLYPARRVRLANSGTADLAVASIVVAGAGFANASASTCPGILAPGAGCDIDIAFGATAAAAFTGTLTVTSNAAGSPHLTQLRGAGSAATLPVLVYLPATPSLDFGSVSAGSVSATQTVTVQNQGPGGVSLTVLNTIGADAASFSIVGGTCSVGTPLFEGGTCTIAIQFAPGSGGAKSASVQIASTGSFPPVLALAGTGLAGPNPSLALSSAAMAFESTRVGAQSVPAAVRITSSGSGVVTIMAIQVSGAFGIQSTTCPPVPFSLPAGTECSVSLNFRPTTQGTAAGTLDITSDAAPAMRQVALSGSGEAAADTTGGGCTIGGPGAPFDPMLWTMLLVALAWLARRELQRRASTRRSRAVARRADECDHTRRKPN